MWQLLEHKVLLRRSFLGILIFLFALSLVACSSVKTSENHPTISTIRVVMDENYPPYAFRDEQGNLQGILVDEWKLWEERTGVKAEIYAFPWGETLGRMKAGEFDVIDTIFYSEDRAQVFDFTEPYAKIDVRIFFQNNISGIAKAEDLKGFRVAVKKGDANVDYLQKHGITDLIYFDSYEQIIQAAKRKEVNVFVIDQPPALYFLYKYDLQQQFNYSGPLEGGTFHRAVRKGNRELLDLVVSGFSRISKAEYDTINARWFGTSYGQDLQQYMPYLGLAAALAALIILVLFIFNQTLQSRVQARTVDLQAALEHLRESETRFRVAIEFFPVPVSLADTQGQILSVNRKFFEEYGYSCEDIPTVDEWLKRAYPEPGYRAKVRSQWNEDVAEGVKNGASTPLREYKVTCKDGRVCDVEIVMHPIGNMWVASFNNITERKQAEVALRESEAIFSSFLEHSPISIFFMDKNLHTLRLSKNFEQALNRPLSELLGKKMDELYHPASAKRMVQDDLQVLSSGQRIDIVEEVSGRIYQTTKFPVFKDGKPDMLVGIAIDVTDRKLMEEALRESEENYRNLVELSPDTIMVHVDGKIAFVNSAGLQLIHAKDVAEVLGLPAINFVHPDQRAKIIERIQKMQASGEKVSPLEEKFVCLDGSIVDVEVVAMPIHYEGRPAVQVVARDITERKRSADMIQQSEKRLRTLIEHSAEALTLLTADGTVLYEGPTVMEITGYLPESRIGQNSLETIFPDDLPTVRGALARVLASPGTSVTSQFRSIRKDGSIWWTEGTATNLLDDPNVQAIVVNYRDVTIRKQAEEKLRESEERNRAIVAALPDLLFELSSDGHFLDCISNDPRRLLVPPEQAIGHRMDEILPLDVATLTMGKIQQTLSEKKMQVYEYSLTIDQTTKYYESRMTPLGDNSVLALVRDITDAKRVEQELRQSEQRYRTLFEQANDAIFVETQDDQILDANQRACQILGYTREELVKMHVSDLIAPEIQRKRPAIRHELSYYGRNPFESLDVRKDGSIIPVEVTNSILPNGLAISIVRDITERKQTEEALRKSEAQVRSLNVELEKRVVERTAQLEVTNRELEAFSYSVSHDLRAPLRAIDGFSRIVLEDYGTLLGADGQKLLNHVSLESQRMAQLIDALLNLSRMSRAELHNEVVDLSALAQQVVYGLRQSQPHRQVDCVIAENVTGRGDIRLLNVVLENILGNAWKFTSKCEKAHIEFGNVQRDDKLIYFVRDNGAGFDPTYTDKLFGAFQRLHRADEFEGTGIGLATVQRIITRHGGQVWAEGEPEKGATFYFTLG